MENTQKVTLELVGVENYQNDPMCYMAVMSRVSVKDFVQMLIEERLRLIEELGKTPQQVSYTIQNPVYFVLNSDGTLSLANDEKPNE